MNRDFVQNWRDWALVLGLAAAGACSTAALRADCVAEHCSCDPISVNRPCGFDCAALCGGGGGSSSGYDAAAAQERREAAAERAAEIAAELERQRLEAIRLRNEELARKRSVMRERIGGRAYEEAWNLAQLGDQAGNNIWDTPYSAPLPVKASAPAVVPMGTPYDAEVTTTANALEGVNAKIAGLEGKASLSQDDQMELSRAKQSRSNLENRMNFLKLKAREYLEKKENTPSSGKDKP